LESILAQSCEDFELIIIDDGSTDNSSSVLDVYARADRRVSVFGQENRGHAHSLNRGCRLARGKYIARMDADDIALPDRFSEQFEFLEEHPRVACVGGAVEVINEKGELLHVDHCPLSFDQIKQAIPHGSPFYHSTVMMRRDAFEALNGYRPAFEDSEDLDLFLRMAERYELANLATVIGRYRIHAQQISQRDFRRHMIASIAARLAARLRRETGNDPFWQVEKLSLDLLYSMGLTRASYYSHLATSAFDRAVEIAAAGTPQLAFPLLAEARRYACRTPGGRQVFAKACVQSGSLCYRERQVLRSLGFCALGYSLAPHLAAGRLSQAVRRRLRRPGAGDIRRGQLAR